MSTISICSVPILKPLNTYDDLNTVYNTGQDPILKKDLFKKGGVYGFIFKGDDGRSMQYIGSSKNLYERMLDHLKGRDTNIRLKRSISKHGISKFIFVIYY
jgi:hypothetical protein